MGTSALKSTAITALDASPVAIPTSGAGGAGLLKEIGGFVTAVAADAAGSTYRLVRIPSNAIVKHLFFESEAQGAGKVNLSVYYSDSATDGTQVANQGVIVPTTGDQFFASDIDCAAAVASLDEVNESGNYPLSKRNLRLWDALGLSVDPGGFFDIVAVVHTTAVTTGTGRLGVSCLFTN